jgi:Trm5-related predicted tRNA methylase
MIRRLCVERKIINQKINFDERNLFQILCHDQDLDEENRIQYPLEKPEGYVKPREEFYNSEYQDPDTWDEVIGHREVIYLSPDADEEIKEFDPETVYVIGGLVDGSINNLQTRHKAQRLNIKSMKLPLDSFRKKYSAFRLCLNINTVFEIIEKFHKYKDIEMAIDEAIPDRFKTGRNKKDLKKKLQAKIDARKAKEVAENDTSQPAD